MENGVDQTQFFTLIIKNWEEVFRIGPKLRKFFFRGQSNSDWSLTTSLERAAQNNVCSLGDLPDIERELLYNFKRMAHHYINNLPSFDEEDLEWLALLQHHGGKTRFLDFTYSYYVAAYFATVDQTNPYDCAIWAVNGTKIRFPLTAVNSTKIKFPITKEDIIYDGVRVSEKWIEIHRILFEEFFKDGAEEPFICFTEPRRLNDRISKQQGLFLCPSKVDCTFENCLIQSIKLNVENLREISSSKLEYFLDNIGLLKIIIPSNIKTRIQYELARMNISATSLFPGLDGYVSSLWNACLFTTLNFNEEKAANKNLNQIGTANSHRRYSEGP